VVEKGKVDTFNQTPRDQGGDSKKDPCHKKKQGKKKGEGEKSKKQKDQTGNERQRKVYLEETIGKEVQKHVREEAQKPKEVPQRTRLNPLGNSRKGGTLRHGGRGEEKSQSRGGTLARRRLVGRVGGKTKNQSKMELRGIKKK